MAVPLLELDGISKRFGRVVVADDLSLPVGPGDAVGIVGPNGAGKTSLFGMISGDLAPDARRDPARRSYVTRLDARSAAGWASGGRTRCRGRSRA